MPSQSNSFHPIESKTSKRLSLLIKVVGIAFLIMTPLSIIIMAILAFNAKEISGEIKIVLIALFIAILCFCVWMLFQKNKKNITTHIIVDEKGIHHYCNRNIVHSLAYAELHSNPETDQYDVLLTEYDESAPGLCIYFFEPELKKATRKTVNLNIDTVITNGNLLLKNFVKGILIFRPDLKIAPNVLDLYRLEEFRK
ncbi:hypothetical protein JOE44_004170 [Chryseobacterium sp. PvR013]|uniref:hypothetical protein n=1 Tax=Chryseobacterium sp. PvR013 TaxID=2806595 RepID=UPI001AE6C637|nr:hypothetical protein [Chryseobacterium sp. PvR013]MBP1167286.1 hypothetical protein [Chryseobacterium sp. PvR013]